MIGESYPHLDQDKFAVMAMELIEQSPNSNGWYCIGFSPRKVRIYTGAYGLRMREAIGIMPRIRYRYRWPEVANAAAPRICDGAELSAAAWIAAAAAADAVPVSEEFRARVAAQWRAALDDIGVPP